MSNSRYWFNWRGRWALSAAVLLLAACLEAAPVPRGYQPRACGFDLDDDGAVGEPHDDCRICNGRENDPDGDGVIEDLIYVDCAQGIDGPSCGSPQTPCATIAWAWGQIADGPGDGAEDVVCFRGTCREQAIRPATSGLEGTREIEATGSAARSWRYPTNPTLLAGWDHDGDGSYPPADPDDVAVIEGMGLTRAFRLEAGSSRLEMAHFTVRDFGRGTTATDTGFIRFGPAGRDLDDLYFHDLVLAGINQERKPGSAVSAINLFTGGARLHWLLFENLLVTDNGGWFARGAGPHGGPTLHPGPHAAMNEEEDDETTEVGSEVAPLPPPSPPPAPFIAEPDVGPWRWRHVTRTAHGCNFADCGKGAASTAFKLWGYVTGIEILDSVWDANVAHWQPTAIGGPLGASFVYAAQCAQGWTIRNNLVIDHKSALRVDGFSPKYCTGPAARPAERIVFDHNEVRNAYEPWALGDIPIRLAYGGDDPGEVIGDVTITHNVFSTTTGWETCFWLQGGHETLPPAGQITFSDNVCRGMPNRFAAVSIGNVQGKEARYPHQRVIFERNVLAGVGHGRLNLLATYAPEQWRADGNVYDPDAGFRWAGDETSIPAATP